MKKEEQMNDAQKTDIQGNRGPGRRRPLDIIMACASIGIVLVLGLQSVSAKTPGPHHPTSHMRILGRYVAYGVPLSATVRVPIALACRTLVNNFNQFRDVPFASNNPRLSPKYPQFRRPDWKPMAWNPKLAELVYSGCPDKSCLKKNGWQQSWHYWEKYTKPLREAGKSLLWRARVDLLEDGRHETIILLTHFFPPNFVRGKLAPVRLKPYCRYIDSRLYMLPTPHPKMAAAFNNGPMSGWGVSGITDLIQDVGSKATPYLSLAWTRSVPVPGIGVSAFESSVGLAYPYPYDFYPMCNIRWIPSGAVVRVPPRSIYFYP